VQHLSEIGLEDVAELIDLVAVGTILISVCPILSVAPWFVLLQSSH